MSQLQYIGARYVPIWYQNSVDQTANWEINVEYEPLTWVTSQNNHLYLSKKTVPDNIGTPAQNTDYWLDMGVITGNVQEIQDQIDAIVANMGDLNDLVTTDKTSLVAAINEAAQSGGGGGSSEDLTTMHILFVGDSYSDGSDEFISKTIDDLGLTNAHNLAVSGTGFTSGTDGNGFLAQIMHYTGTDREQIKRIYVLGGLNDSTSTNTATPSILENNIANFVTYARTEYPNAELYLGYCGNALDGYPLVSGRTLQHRLACKYLYSNQLSFNFADLSGFLATNAANFASDGLHPSAYGTAVLEKALIGWMRTGSVPKVNYPSSSAGAVAYGSSDSNSGISYNVNDGVMELVFGSDFLAHFNTQVTISSGTAIQFCTMSNLYFNRPLDIVMMTRLNNFDGKQYQDALIRWHFYQNTVSVLSQQINSAGNGFQSFVSGAGGGGAQMKGDQVYLVNLSDVN